MTLLILQSWGACFYLLNKLFFLKAEKQENKKIKKDFFVFAWSVYLIALPAWIVLFITKDNWIAASVEAGGAPAMVLGLWITLRGAGSIPKSLDFIAKWAVVLGLFISYYRLGSLFSLTQLLEIGTASGFLVGTYLLAKENMMGYLWLILGNISCATLMGFENFYLLMSQQLFSLCFVIQAFCYRKKQR